MKDLERKLELALKEIERLNQENHQLKQKLANISKSNSEIADLSRPSVIKDVFVINGRRLFHIFPLTTALIA